MKIKVASLYSLQALFISIVIALVYLQMIALPVLRGQSKVYAFVVGDAMLYMDPIYSNDYLRTIDRGIFSANRFNMLGMILLGKTALWISPQNPEYVVFCFNILVLAATIRNFQHILLFYRCNKYHLFLLLFLLNPLVLMSTVALNKEIWGLFFVSLFLRHRIYRKYIRYSMAVLVSFFIRDVYAAAGILFLIMSTVRLKKIYCLLFITLLVAFVTTQGMQYLYMRGQDELSTGFSLLLNNIQSYPFGYLLVYFPKLILDMIGQLSPIRFFEIDSANLVAVYTRVSCLLFLICACTILHKLFTLKRILNRHMVNLFFAYTFIACIPLVIQHRYIFPVYPVLILIALLAVHKHVDCREAAVHCPAGPSNNHMEN
jgi:hypothetical protein